jgi:nucleoside-diphosphate-sugar epimerase
MLRVTTIYLDRKGLGEAVVKRPAAICRKVAMARSGDEIEVWGDGEQTRSFLDIEECVEGTVRLLRSNFAGPINIGSEEMVTIN